MDQDKIKKIEDKLTRISEQIRECIVRVQELESYIFGAVESSGEDFRKDKEKVRDKVKDLLERGDEEILEELRQYCKDTNSRYIRTDRFLLMKYDLGRRELLNVGMLGDKLNKKLEKLELVLENEIRPIDAVTIKQRENEFIAKINARKEEIIQNCVDYAKKLDKKRLSTSEVDGIIITMGLKDTSIFSSYSFRNEISKPLSIEINLLLASEVK